MKNNENACKYIKFQFRVCCSGIHVVRLTKYGFPNNEYCHFLRTCFFRRTEESRETFFQGEAGK